MEPIHLVYLIIILQLSEIDKVKTIFFMHCLGFARYMFYCNYIQLSVEKKFFVFFVGKKLTKKENVLKTLSCNKKNKVDITFFDISNN